MELDMNTKRKLIQDDELKTVSGMVLRYKQLQRLLGQSCYKDHCSISLIQSLKMNAILC